MPALHRPVPRRAPWRSTSMRSAAATAPGSRRSSSTSSLRASSGDSACVLLAPSVMAEARGGNPGAGFVVGCAVSSSGLLGLQLALQEGRLFVLEANPRASRTVPFVSKALRLPLVDHACRLLLGEHSGASACPERAEPRAFARRPSSPSPSGSDRSETRARDALDRGGDGGRGFRGVGPHAARGGLCGQLMAPAENWSTSARAAPAGG